MKQNYLLGSAACLILAACDPAVESSDSTPKTIPTAKSTEKTDGFNANKNVYFGDLHLSLIHI